VRAAGYQRGSLCTRDLLPCAAALPSKRTRPARASSSPPLVPFFKNRTSQVSFQAEQFGGNADACDGAAEYAEEEEQEGRILCAGGALLLCRAELRMCCPF